MISKFSLIEWIGPEDNFRKKGDRGQVAKINGDKVFVEWYDKPPKSGSASGPYHIDNIKIIED